MTSRRVRAGALIAALLIAAPLVVNAAPAPRHTGFCDSFLSFLCPKGDPVPGETTPPPTPGVPDVPGVVDELVPDSDAPAEPDEAEPDAEKTPVPAPVDDGAPVFAGIPASMGAGGLSFTGLRGISIVSVPTVSGDPVRALKIEADSITITGFSLTVRPPDGPGLVTTADTMSLKGNASVYLGSVTATTVGGKGLTLGLDTPPPLGDVEPGLLKVSMGLVGTIADSIQYTNTDQNIVAAK
ncbi:hypothetical protein [Microbacterium sp.]|uniref:hypothetical protein n=1 Tax=Microbacterium sp. TaxID=51671 RepID=UPI002B886914|nr:hypothetical protein [Microbacterium sp.]HWK77979.1 hypothetical protein [Microbacterium sp.]